MNPTLAPNASGADAGVAQAVKPSSLVCSNEAIVSIPKSSRMLPKPRYKPSSGVKLIPIAPSTPTAGVGRGIHCASIRCMKEGAP